MFGNARTRFLALSLGLTAIFPIPALAQAANTAPAQAAGGKVGIVNIQQAIMECNDGKKEIEALQQRFAGRQTDLKNLNDELENLKKQYQAQADKLSQEESNNRAKTIESKQKTLQRNMDDFQSDTQQAEQEIVNRVGEKVMKALEKYANANGYSVILDVSNPQTPVLWASQGPVITRPWWMLTTLRPRQRR